MNEMFELDMTEVANNLMKALGSPLPDSDDVSRWDLEKQRRVYLDDDVAYNVIQLQRLILRWNIEDRRVEDECKAKGLEPFEREPIWIYIMSYGGDLDYMWSLIDIITASKTPVYTVNVGVAASAASLIFLAGHKRFMLPTARMIVHEGSAQLAGDAIKVMDQSESYKKQLKQMKDYILKRTEIPRTQLMKKRSNDWELDAEFCLANKACDMIVNSLDEII